MVAAEPQRDALGDGDHAAQAHRVTLVATDIAAPASLRNAVSRSGAPALATSSVALPCARTRPARMRPRRSHREASSITWLDTRIVVPADASSRKWDQNSTRSTGSTP